MNQPYGADEIDNSQKLEHSGGGTSCSVTGFMAPQAPGQNGKTTPTNNPTIQGPNGSNYTDRTLG